MQPTTKTVIFITGAFVTHHGWDPWIAYFNSKGYNCIAPPWPYKDASADILRKRQPDDTDLAGLRLSDLLDHYIDIVKKLPEKPIAIGHSLGGLITQLLLNRDLVAAAVAIHSVAPQGVISFEPSFIRSIWKPLGLFTSIKKTHLMSLKEWQYAFTNGMAPEEQKKSYEENTIPESKQVLRDTLTSAAKVDFTKPHAPLLFIDGTADNIVPASLNYSNFMKYQNGNSITDYKEFEGKNHFVLGLPSWKDEADYILAWIEIMDQNNALG
jgi:pimeloyl-ACP methyl ester carboxylesterase